jgi:SAM-dependent methyltransferase
VGLRSFIQRARRSALARIRWEQRLNDWEERRFDRKLGIDTGGTVEPATLTVKGDSSQGITYRGTQPRLARWWLDALGVNPREFVFVDMGSGKGRVLLFAARHGFERVLGVEFAEELHEVAVENARIARKRGLAIEPILQDATRFEFPDEPLVVYFSNPFREAVMELVLANITAWYERKPRPLIVVYEQMTVERPPNETRNLELLDRLEFLDGRTLAPPRGFADRSIVRPFTVRIYETAEVREGA